MIISKDTSPERDLYYLGAKVVELISDESSTIDFLDLYKKLNLHKEVSMELYSLTLDWLYIVGAVENSGQGSINKCF